MIKTFFKGYSIDFDRTKVINTPNWIYVDGYFFMKTNNVQYVILPEFYNYVAQIMGFQGSPLIYFVFPGFH